MFDIGFWEVFLIGAIALVVLGPERLPGAARSVGRTLGKWRRTAHDLRREFMQELDDSEFKAIKETVSEVKELKGEMLTHAQRAKADLDKEIKAFDEGAGELKEKLSADQPADVKKDAKAGKKTVSKAKASTARTTKKPASAKAKEKGVKAKTTATKAKSTAAKAKDKS